MKTAEHTTPPITAARTRIEQMLDQLRRQFGVCAKSHASSGAHRPTVLPTDDWKLGESYVTARCANCGINLGFLHTLGRRHGLGE